MFSFLDSLKFYFILDWETYWISSKYRTINKLVNWDYWS